MHGRVLIDSNAIQLLNGFLKDVTFTQLAVLVDENTQKYCYPLIQSALPPHHVIEVKASEECKNLITCTHIWQQLTDLQFDRHALVLVLGGGVLGDMGGFCAATYKRGINFILMPTTLLAQVDASVGGKLGIDFANFKNHIGVFQQPVATLISPQFLSTLPQRELRSGFAEIVKHCLIA
ncbi:MAG: iron-containing alcohol dehydrogenase, partial [Cyclobacteriaceae bacterium]